MTGYITEGDGAFLLKVVRTDSRETTTEYFAFASRAQAFLHAKSMGVRFVHVIYDTDNPLAGGDL